MCARRPGSDCDLVTGESLSAPIEASSCFQPSSLPIPRRSGPEGGWLSLQAHWLSLQPGRTSRELGKSMKLLSRARFHVPGSTFRRGQLSFQQHIQNQNLPKEGAGKSPETSLNSSASGLDVNPTQSHLGRDRGPSASSKASCSQLH